jgi:hypothetical protein
MFRVFLALWVLGSMQDLLRTSFSENAVYAKFAGYRLPHSQVDKGERMSGREILAAMRALCP